MSSAGISDDQGWSEVTNKRKEKQTKQSPPTTHRNTGESKQGSGRRNGPGKSGDKSSRPAGKSGNGRQKSGGAPRQGSQRPSAGAAAGGAASPVANTSAATTVAAPVTASAPVVASPVVSAVAEHAHVKAAPAAVAAAPATAEVKTEARRELYPPIKAYRSGFLKVSSIHNVYYEEAGNPRGNPVVFLHGGPGGGLADYYRQYFNPKLYRVVLFDQRGSGQSTPTACLEENTTWDLVADIEKLREHLQIEKWVVFGGSWGSTLALAYAESHPARVKALILRGIFLLRHDELEWFYQKGASFMFPDAWDKYLAPIPAAERAHLMHAYYRRLTGTNEEEKLKCARAWSVWEMSTSRLFVDAESIRRAENDDKFALAFARIEAHYFVNAGFMREDGQLLKDAHKIAHIPGVIVQGRYDVVCPAYSAWDLHKVWPKAQLKIISDAGHSAKEPGIVDELVKACDAFATL